MKPAAEDASVGIDTGAVCTTKRALKKRLAEMTEQWDEVLVQEYVAGREFNVGFVGKQVLPIAEICFDNMPEGQLADPDLRRQVGRGQCRGPRLGPGLPGGGAGRHRSGGSWRWPARPGSSSAAPRGTAGWTSGWTPPDSRTCSRSIPTPTSPTAPGCRAWPGPRLDYDELIVQDRRGGPQPAQPSRQAAAALVATTPA